MFMINSPQIKSLVATYKLGTQHVLDAKGHQEHFQQGPEQDIMNYWYHDTITDTNKSSMSFERVDI